MRHAFIPIILLALMLSGPPSAGPAFAQAAPAIAGADAAQITAFLKCLQSSVALGNRLKVASLVHYPLKAWVDGEELVIDNDSEFQANYSRIFDASTKKAIADARVETLVTNQQGITFDNGRLWFRPVTERKNAIKIVAVNDPNQPR